MGIRMEQQFRTYLLKVQFVVLCCLGNDEATGFRNCKDHDVGYEAVVMLIVVCHGFNWIFKGVYTALLISVYSWTSELARTVEHFSVEVTDGVMSMLTCLAEVTDYTTVYCAC